MGSRKIIRWSFFLALVVLFFAGMWARCTVLSAQYELVRGRTLPFTLESALQYRLTEKIYYGHGLPEVDTDVQYPEGVNPRSTYSIGAEYIYAAAAHLMPSRIPLPERVRGAALFWFCLGIPLLAIWVYGLFGSRLGGMVAGAFYAVALSSVIRSTGQELSRENFALPLLIAHFAFDAWARRQEKQSLAFWWRAVCSALCLAFAAMTWDLIQFYVALWATGACVRLWRAYAGEGDGPGLDTVWITQCMALLAASFINPYMRAHLWWLSPGMLLAYGALAGMLSAGSLTHATHRKLRLVTNMLLPLPVGMLLGHFYRHAYGHFAELLFAKLRFLNVKPMDPALLTFEQRIMWVPALNSLTWGLTWDLFPAMLLLSLGAIAILCRGRRGQPKMGCYQLIFNFAASLAAFVLFVRFHVFLAVFAAAVLGGALSILWDRGGWKGYLMVVVLALGWMVEMQHVVKEPWRWGRPGVYYEELDELTGWAAEHMAPDPVLANFGVSASLLTYGGCPIVLHPKFESQRIRDRVREYGNVLFTGTEKDFRDWIEPYGAQYYVYALGEFSRRSPERQMRYFVNALEPPEDAAARMFEFTPDESRYFKLLWGNHKYRVFDIVTRRDQMMSARQTQEAWIALERGDLPRADELAIWALKFDPDNTNAMEVIRHVASLYGQGFTPWPIVEQDMK
ncbi:MAG: hypothetical protein EOM20_03400 [Spartobacteria bacterium]|nr:hypothetical protein [Spartobacteria bacterium]